MLAFLRITSNSIKIVKPSFPVRNHLFGAVSSKRWYTKKEQTVIPKQKEALKYNVPSPTCPPPPPGESNKSNLKYIIAAIAIAAGGLGLAYFNDLLPKEAISIKEDVKKSKKEKKPYPESSKDIPDEIPYLLIGGGTASFSAFRAIKGHDAKAKVLVISNEIEMPYMRPPLSKELWFNPEEKEGVEPLKFKQWNGVERSLYYEPEDYYTDPMKLMESPNGGVAVVRGYTVQKIDVVGRKAILTDGTELSYGECLIATGARPKNLDIFESASLAVKDKVSLFKNIHDFELLKDIMAESSKIAIIGGGFLGSELSCALAKYGENHKKQLDVYQIFHEGGNMGKVLPEYLSDWTTDRVREEGVTVIPKSQVKSVELQNKMLKLELIDDTSILVDHAIVAVGSEPNTDLAKTSDLETDGQFGGFVVNAELKARSHLYVAGDAACFYDPKLGRRRVEHHDHAVVSGRLAGENMAGMNKPYVHQSMFWSDLGPKIGYEAIGIIDSALPTVGVFAKATPDDVSLIAQTDKLQAASANVTTSPKVESILDHTSITKEEPPPQKEEKDENFGKGVVFYLRDDKVVGVLLWNVFNGIGIARKIVAQNTKYDDLNEVAKLFNIHN